MNEIPVYLFTGFMDSGKTTLVKETLFDDGFTEGGRSVVICCEDGDVEYDEEELKKINARLVMVENEEDFTEEFLKCRRNICRSRCLSNTMVPGEWEH